MSKKPSTSTSNSNSKGGSGVGGGGGAKTSSNSARSDSSSRESIVHQDGSYRSNATASKSTTSNIKFFLYWILVPFAIGWILTDSVFPNFHHDFLSTVLGPYLGIQTSSSSDTNDFHHHPNKKSTTTSSTYRNRNMDRLDRILYQQQDDQEQQEQPKESDCFDKLIQNVLTQEEQSALKELMQQQQQQSSEGMVAMTLHRNGQVESCGSSWNFLHQLQYTLNTSGGDCIAFGKYDTESLLTSALHSSSGVGETCYSMESDITRENNSNLQPEEEGLFGYCDMGTDRTPILLDHEQLVPIDVLVGDEESEDDVVETYLPCHFHTREGIRVTSFQMLLKLMIEAYQDQNNNNNDEDENSSSEVHLYAVPAGRVFMFAPAHVGEIFNLPHIQGADPDEPVYLRVLSTEPRVFDIFNFFTRDESTGLVERALQETKESHRIKRSSTGASGYNVFSRRTSENGFDTHGKTAQAVKRRCFEVLGFDEYIEGHSDGLQILRYNQTKAYVAHMDWIDNDPKHEHDFDSAKQGGNRFATILLYMTDLGPGDGGETVFVKGKPLLEEGETAVDYQTALQELRESEQGKLFEQGSWEEEMVAQCRSSLAVRPNSARAVLFYSQLPNGKPDRKSRHGGCPVLTDEPKWAANLWVWNTPRSGFPGAPKKFDDGKDGPAVDPGPPKKHAEFINQGTNPDYADAELYYEDQFWAKLGHGSTKQAVTTYETQVWHIKVDGEIKETFVIGKDKEQFYKF